MSDFSFFNGVIHAALMLLHKCGLQHKLYEKTDEGLENLVYFSGRILCGQSCEGNYVPINSLGFAVLPAQLLCIYYFLHLI